MALTTAERNRRKRERKKKNREAQRKSEEDAKKAQKEEKPSDEVEIEYVADTVLEDAPAGFDEVKRIVGEAALAFVSDDDNGKVAEMATLLLQSLLTWQMKVRKKTMELANENYVKCCVRL